MVRERVLEIALCALCWAAFVALILSVGGCALFRWGRVEARADYNVIADDCSVSLVAVGYCGE